MTMEAHARVRGTHMSEWMTHDIGLYAGDVGPVLCGHRRQRGLVAAGAPAGVGGAPAGATPQARFARSLRDAEVLVLGAARSGTAVADLLLRLGAHATLADRAVAPFETPGMRTLVERGLRVAPGRDDPDLLPGHDLVVVSPGVPPDHPLLRVAASRGVAVTGELELAARLARAPLICVTGTNGKSTTVELIGALLAAAGRQAQVTGNIGRPLSASVLRTGPHDLLVVEVSSFQLETASRLRPRVAVLLNVAADHLDRHGDLATYARLKLRLFQHQSSGDDAVAPAGWDGPPLPGGGRRLEFGTDPTRVRNGATVSGGWIVLRAGGGEERVIDIERLALRGPHNLRNVLAALAAVERFAIDPAVLAGVLHDFAGLRHRLERVAVLSGVAFVNDSKATNVHALRSALTSFSGGIHLLAGGRDKGGDFESLANLVTERVQRVYRFGESAPRLEEAWPETPGEDCGDLDAAVRAAASRAVPGEVVLLAPGCASFDQFRDYEARGEVFRRAVLRLAARAAADAVPPERPVSPGGGA
jgi:UDP-N-acetylmuramoylalanine--D-glutamate ligase